MTKLILTLALAMGAATFVPRPLAADECTRAYIQCLNDSYDLTGWFQTMADIECFAGYVGCVAKNVIMQ
jgi:hypothetical protein